MLLLPAAVTVADAQDTLRLLTQAQGGDSALAGEVLVLDATPLRRFDSSALALLLECQRLAAARGQAFSVRGAPAKLVALARLYGLESVLTFEEAAAAPARIGGIGA